MCIVEIAIAASVIKAARVYITGHGQVLSNVHPKADCAGRPCVIHAPSEHTMSLWPTLWRSDRDLMERTCEHGQGHPDPDHIAFVRESKGESVAQFDSVHGCDGCCIGVPE